jgi:hypothetical protein
MTPRARDTVGTVGEDGAGGGCEVTGFVTGVTAMTNPVTDPVTDRDTT